MTTTFLLVRHAAHDKIGNFLAGRTADVPLGPAGREQAERLATRLAGENIGAIYASPRKRTQETAAAIAAASDIPEVETADALDEVDFGTWSGKTFEVLNGDPHWRHWNSKRSLARAPGGETMLEVQSRVISLVETLGRHGDDGKIVLVSHADVIKALVCHVLGLSADAWSRFEIAPASISTLVAGDWGAKIVTLNENGS
ncbi:MULTISPECIES: histidine phosphatase family protein [Sinorhizobium]|uniref:Phosphoglycerate mutase n=2 Tax=Sinorhizobium TaxID=28105 RepID=A0A2S3YFY3_9HYPH|nr:MULTISPECIES: histidine phosphatase family protein [Sinorhizobium]ASY58054.1 putative, related to broad specificity phosphatase [Sinorhizobium sp. CCBAU 05631]AUX77733.1 phosphoglycerate mutase family protein [Sinorhizobium fredii]PDT40056.1 histidine phosphatase family protein [Sinorhizobium sp. FG01]PDT51543.1 histidine phosphatase family protein [Sinorhizobium sp. NG07B]POH25145.1 phosphoglycerate mutase [Sinorhizobium americanum]